MPATPDVLIAPADRSNDPALRALSLRSKAFWGYDAHFMAKAAPLLALKPEWYAGGRVFAARCDGALAGVSVVLPPDADGAAELAHLFVDPPFMGRGVGRALVNHAVARARDEGARLLTVLSDPFARAFYETCGARFLREDSTEGVDGRPLPFLVWELTA
jgi:GNAT superfamily N-acetyltransferase